jgi:DNA replication protein DnaC
MELPSLEECCAKVRQDIGGIDSIVEELISQIKLLELLAGTRQAPPGPRGKGAMLIGKPGTGKTALAACITSELSQLDVASVVVETYDWCMLRVARIAV